MNETTTPHVSITSNQTPEQLERSVMAHRYLYYVLAEAYLPDHLYDELERGARAVCPLESAVHRLGSSLPSSYTQEQKDWASGLLESWKNTVRGQA
jgi:NAD-dependent DNA ligase